MIYLLTTIGLKSGGSIALHFYTQTVRRTTHLTTRVTHTVIRYWLVDRFLIPEGTTVSAWMLSSG
jgi:hypothetical protein